ncbi:tRNA 2-selenouridine(34) synthase MnmH [Guptibacillus algicola]|uniref:tRNA 2-selenouridine(34) synthase MnmH n=1 Tax=Guptibacillus algicola TaxID=225844 RepID=UPI001CD3AF1E|nr:tRNA 2-selenouridine(34) synthase MnmH [Alkalihalobacillus algicola]MCA0989111.1 tRNA 2-selenouridine(34) synthase MnmH [Alkalihalobacillus algicola]
MKTISINELFDREIPIIDVRTPAEYEQFHIPGAVNMPIFSNEEREIVGTTYKKEGTEAAKELGISLVSPSLPEFYKLAKTISQGKEFVIYCWRGGMRSKSLAVIFEMMGLPCRQLVGGIRSYRQTIIEQLEKYAKREVEFVVLEGLTGTSKTEILHHLKENGYPVIDLEGLAAHRGSVFGRVGLPERSQKEFEAKLYDRLNEIGETDYYVIESESKRLGNIIVPNFILEGKQKGTRIHVHAPLSYRIQTILNTYHPEQNAQKIVKGIHKIEKRLSEEDRQHIYRALEEENYGTVVEKLLLDYYDPRYTYKATENIGEVINVHYQSLVEGCHLVQDEVDRLVPKLRSEGEKVSL